jgi:NitT/TauT family transport system ATP-binding protein
MAAGEITALIGPSGCGKTSLIKIIAGLLCPSVGSVLVDGKGLSGPSPGTAVIFQDYGLLPWKTVRANAELPLVIAGTLKKDRPLAAGLLEEFGLSACAGRYPHQLSGGMRQRLAIVRALASRPRLLLMDEPFSSLDAISREEAQDLLLRIQEQRRLSIVLVTHSIEEAVYLADTVYVMRRGTGGGIAARMAITRPSENGYLAARTGFRRAAAFLEYCSRLRDTLAAATEGAAQ